MKKLLALPVLCASLSLTGCYKTVTKLPKVEAPESFRSASVDELKKLISDRDATIRTLNAKVLLTATTTDKKTNEQTTYTSFKGYIFVRQPADLRVIMQVPVLGSVAMDMVSDGSGFKMTIPPRNLAIEGSNTITEPSKDALYNLRPPVFFDSLLVPGVDEKSEYVNLTESTRLVPPSKRNKPIVEEPDYDLTVSTLSSEGNKVLSTRRVVHISRVNMLPYEQDIYEGRAVVTSATYDQYKEFNGIQFPTLITIRRPLDKLELKIQITSLELNGQLADDQFQLDIPKDFKVQTMK